jgi:hypothetical protein
LKEGELSPAEKIAIAGLVVVSVALAVWAKR